MIDENDKLLLCDLCLKSEVETTFDIAKARDALAEARTVIADLVVMMAHQTKLLTAYRLGRPPPGKTLDALVERESVEKAAKKWLEKNP